MYYYSSGYIDKANTKHLQGVVKVQPRQEQSGAASVQVGGVEARHVTRGKCGYDVLIQQLDPPENLRIIQFL